MKKILSSLISIVAAVGFGQTTVSTFTPTAGQLQTNIYNGATRLYSLTVSPGSTRGVNETWYVYDSPLYNTLRSGTVGTAILEYTNAGYATYTTVSSNMNWLAAGSRPLLGVNSNVNFAGVTMTITNSAALSNYTFTASNWVDGAVYTRPLKFSFVNVSNSTYTIDFPNGLWFRHGISITNTVPLTNAMTVTLEHSPAL